jgi:hypothetical protein
VDPATVDPEVADPETEAMDLSTEQAFFARAAVLSDHPVSFDTESRWPTLDLEEREQRRARFTRVVSIIVGTLGVGALLAVTRPGPSAMQAVPVAASAPVSVEVDEIQRVEPTPTLLPELSVSAPDASSDRVEAAPSVSAPARAATAVPSASTARSRKRAPQAPGVVPVVPVVPVESSKRPPPTARFAD